MFLILQKCLCRTALQRIHCLIVYFCMQHAKEKEEGGFFCLSVTVGSADSASDLSLSFLPILCSKTFSAFITILMSSEVQLTHMPNLLAAWNPQPSSAGMGQVGLLEQHSCTPLLCLQVLAEISLLQPGNCCWTLLLSNGPGC